METKEKNLDATVGSFTVKSGLAQMLKGGVIMDVVSVEHAVIAADVNGLCTIGLVLGESLIPVKAVEKYRFCDVGQIGMHQIAKLVDPHPVSVTRAFVYG